MSTIIGHLYEIVNSETQSDLLVSQFLNIINSTDAKFYTNGVVTSTTTYTATTNLTLQSPNIVLSPILFGSVPGFSSSISPLTGAAVTTYYLLRGLNFPISGAVSLYNYQDISQITPTTSNLNNFAALGFSTSSFVNFNVTSSFTIDGSLFSSIIKNRILSKMCVDNIKELNNVLTSYPNISTFITSNNL